MYKEICIIKNIAISKIFLPVYFTGKTSISIYYTLSVNFSGKTSNSIATLNRL